MSRGTGADWCGALRMAVGLAALTGAPHAGRATHLDSHSIAQASLRSNGLPSA